MAYVGWEGWRDSGTLGLWWSLATLSAFFTCIVLHELGHSFTAMRFGVGVRRILLMPIGGMAEFDSIPREPKRELLITLAGPAMNFLIAACLWPVVSFPQDWDAGAIPASIDDLLRLLLVANLVMGVFNLVPVFPMDGGRILRALLATRIPYLRATYWAATIGKVLAAAGAVVSLYYELPLRAALFIFIFLAGEAEYRAVKRRELAEAAWRDWAARMPGSAPAAEPPILTGWPGA